jgi:hypothetical protein
MLESGEVSWAQSVSLGDDRNEIDTGAETLHDLNIKRLESMPGGSYEVKAGVNTEVNLVDSAGLLLLKHIRLMLIIEELNNWHPRVPIVHIIAKSGCVDDGQAY